MHTTTVALLWAVLLAAPPALAAGGPAPQSAARGLPAAVPPVDGQAAAQADSAPLTFAQVLDLAMRQNLDLAAVRRGRAIRQAGVRAAGQWANPEFSAEITRDVPHGDLALGLPIDIGRTRSRRIEVAREELAMAGVDEKSAILELRRNVRLAFYGLMAAEEALALAEEIVSVTTRVRDVAQARFESGAAPRLDVMQADLGVIRSRAERDLARSARRAAQADLNALLDRPPGMRLTITGEGTDIPPLPTLDQATEAATRSSVELLAVDQEAAIERRRLSLLKAERVPAPVFSFGTALNAPGEFNVGAHAGISVALPLFSRNQGEILGSTATIDAIRARRDALVRRLEARVYAGFERVTARRAEVEAFRTTLVPTATELQGLAEESYRLGRNSILAALDAQRSLRDVKYEYLQAALELQAAVADLEAIIGGPIQ